MAATVHSQQEALQRPLIYWRLEAISGNYKDSSGNGFDGTPISVTQGATGQIGLCGDFDGTDDEIINTDTALTDQLESLTEFSMFTFGSAPSFNNYDSSVSFGVSNDNDVVSMYTHNNIGGNGMSMWEDGTDTISGAGTEPADNTFAGYGYRRNNATSGDALINGVVAQSTTANKTTAAAVAGFVVGRYIGAGERHTGKLDEVIFHLRAISDNAFKYLSLRS